MICLPSQQPLLRIGDLPLAPCEEQWLQERIEQAAAAAGRGEFWLAADVARGVMDYLAGHHPGSTIDLAALLDRVRALLARIDCPDVAEYLDSSPPPQRLSLDDLAAEAGNGFELQFFAILRRFLESCARHGIREIRLSGIKSCVRSLRNARKWRPDCESLEQEIIAFVRHHRLNPSLVSP